MLHLRIVSPLDRTDAVIGLLRSDPAVFNLALLPGAALDPAGDIVLCDVVREGVNQVIDALRDEGVNHDGTLSILHIDVSMSDAAAEAERRTPGYATDAAVWEEVDARVRDESVLSASFVVFVVIATLIATVGLMQDAPILIVGAMVVGPEFGPLAGLSVGLLKLRWSRIHTALTTLAAGFAAGVLATFLSTELVDFLDLVPAGFSPRSQPQTGFVVQPSLLSLGVAFLAGIAGMLSLTEAKAGALVGVLISVTTIPAVAAIGMSAALSRWDDARGAAGHLGVNVTGLVLAGVLTLWTQRELWERVPMGRKLSGSPRR